MTTSQQKIIIMLFFTLMSFKNCIAMRPLKKRKTSAVPSLLALTTAFITKQRRDVPFDTVLLPNECNELLISKLLKEEIKPKLPKNFYRASSILGHTGDIVQAVDVTQDGIQIVSGSANARVQIWNKDHNDYEHNLTLIKKNRYRDGVKGVGFMPDEKNVIFTKGKELFFWDVGKQRFEKIGQDGNIIYALKILKEDDEAVTGGFGTLNGTVKIWDLRSGKCKINFVREAKTVNDIAVSHSRSVIACSQRSDAISLWDKRAKQAQKDLRILGCLQCCVAFNPINEAQLISGDSNGLLYCWDIRKETPFQVEKNHWASVNCVDMHGDVIFSGASDKVIHLYNLRSGEPIAAFVCCWSAIESLTLTPDGNTLVSGARDHSVAITKIKKLRDIYEGRVHLLEAVDLANQLNAPGITRRKKESVLFDS